MLAVRADVMAGAGRSGGHGAAVGHVGVMVVVSGCVADIRMLERVESNPAISFRMIVMLLVNGRCIKSGIKESHSVLGNQPEEIITEMSQNNTGLLQFVLSECRRN